MHGTPPHTVWAVAALLLNALVWGLSWWPFKRLEALGLQAGGGGQPSDSGSDDGDALGALHAGSLRGTFRPSGG